MHILKIIHGYPPDYNAGSEVYSKSICEELSKSHVVSVFTREENPFQPCFEISSEKVNSNLSIFRVNNPQGKDGYRHSQLDSRFRKLVMKLEPDVAHVGHLNHLSTGIIDVLNELKIPIVFTLHDFWLMCPRGQFLTRGIGNTDNFKLCSGQDNHKCATSCYSVYFSGNQETTTEDESMWSAWVGERMNETKGIIDKVDLFIAPSHYLMNRFIKDFGVPENKIVYLDYGFPGYLKPSKNETEKDVYTFGYIGTHIPAKGVNLLIEAFNRIDTDDAHLRIYGRDIGQPTHGLRKLAATSSNRIQFCDEYDNEEIVQEVFDKVDCIVVPSIWGENSPLVIHEAQACGMPVITADYGGMAEYVQQQVNGLLFKHRCVDSLVQQLEYAIAHPMRMKELGTRGYLQSKEGKVPSIESHCSELEKYYHMISGPKSRLWRITLDTNPEDCNLKCIMCEEHSPYSNFIETMYKETGVKRRRMTFSTVENLFNQAVDLGIKEIIPSTMGEPLLYKGIDGVFQLARETGIKINLTTNGTFPKKSVEDWAELIIPNTSDVKISWNGATKETAEQVMTGLDYGDTLNKLRRFIMKRDQICRTANNYCSITLQLTFMENNMHELEDIVRLAAELNVDRVKGHHLWAHFDEIKSLSMKYSPDSIDRWNRYVENAHQAAAKHLRPNGEQVKLENIDLLSDKLNGQVPDYYECPFLGKELWISATGKISPCCAPDELRAELGDFGNVNDRTLSEVLKSPNYQALCADYKTRSLCSTCNMRRPKA